jgi:hypothetical protein
MNKEDINKKTFLNQYSNINDDKNHIDGAITEKPNKIYIKPALTKIYNAEVQGGGGDFPEGLGGSLVS